MMFSLTRRSLGRFAAWQPTTTRNTHQAVPITLLGKQLRNAHYVKFVVLIRVCFVFSFTQLIHAERNVVAEWQ